ncbi:hypothetical protein DMP35_23960 [Klebsiella variicola]|nr:hypothetical protein CW266_18725 [Klebsiella sp. T11]PXG66113.1 hypothetical protein DMP35_23960 [Klebsiella variicola]
MKGAPHLTQHFALQKGVKTRNPRELTSVSDRGWGTQTTHLQRERRRLNYLASVAVPLACQVKTPNSKPFRSPF